LYTLQSFAVHGTLKQHLKSKPMQQLTESLFRGTWRSYKAFLHTGEVKNHSKDKYLEFKFGEAKHLSITAYDNGKGKKPEETKDWNIILKDKRHYLTINDKGPVYEVITINHVALVLMDTNTNEKLFFAQPETWEHYVKTPAFTAAL
jgi:hypothetical protein